MYWQQLYLENDCVWTCHILASFNLGEASEGVVAPATNL